MGRQLFKTPTLLYSRDNNVDLLCSPCWEICAVYWFGFITFICTDTNIPTFWYCKHVLHLDRGAPWSVKIWPDLSVFNTTQILSLLSVYSSYTNAVLRCNLLAGGAECGTVPHKGRVQQTEGGAEEDWTVAVRKHHRYHLCSTQVWAETYVISMYTHICFIHNNTFKLYLMCPFCIERSFQFNLTSRMPTNVIKVLLSEAQTALFFSLLLLLWVIASKAERAPRQMC